MTTPDDALVKELRESQEAFEAWQDREDHMQPWQLEMGDDGRYRNPHVQIEWRAWQAAWEQRGAMIAAAERPTR